MPRLSVFLAALVVLAACDSGLEADEVGPVALRPQAQAAMSPGVLRAGLTATGRVGTGSLVAGAAGAPEVLVESDYDPIYAAGLWLAGAQGGETRVNALYDDESNYGPCGYGTDGVFHLSADSAYALGAWPVSAGAPVTASGTPRVYGDEMLWTSLCSVPSDPTVLLDRPAMGLRVNVAVFRYDADPLSLYVRYELRNEGTHPLTDAYLGQWADPDWVEPGDNLSGYDVGRRLSYVYLSPDSYRTDGRQHDAAERGQVTGFSVLETPGDAPVAGHRRLDKNLAGPTTDVPSTRDGYTYGAYLHALMGLGNDGSELPGAPSRFAFTGDPVAGTGDVDAQDPDGDGAVNGRELRTLLSAGPFSLAPGEARPFTVVWSVAVGDDLGDGIGKLAARVDAVRAAPSRWRF